MIDVFIYLSGLEQSNYNIKNISTELEDIIYRVNNNINEIQHHYSGEVPRLTMLTDDLHEVQRELEITNNKIKIITNNLDNFLDSMKAADLG